MFWDVNLEGFYPSAYPGYTIFRVLEHGDQPAVAWLRQTFSGSQITAVVRRERRCWPVSTWRVAPDWLFIWATGVPWIWFFQPGAF